MLIQNHLLNKKSAACFECTVAVKPSAPDKPLLCFRCYIYKMHWTGRVVCVSSMLVIFSRCTSIVNKGLFSEWIEKIMSRDISSAAVYV